MARIRKEKGRIVQKPAPGDISKSKKTQKKTGDVMALGGNAEDAALLKNIDDSITTGTANKDPALQHDVSKFLKDLNLQGNLAKDTKGKGKEKAQPPKEKPTTPAKSEKSNEKSAKKDNKKEKKKGSGSKAEQPAPAAAAPTTSQAEEKPKVALPTKVSLNPKSHFVFQPTSQWYAALPMLQPTPSSTITSSQLSGLSIKAAALHEQDISTFLTASSSNTSSSEASFLSKIIQSGTLSDRLSALTLLVQSSPLHNLKALENLKQMAERGKGKGGREESLKALRCIVDWWTGGGAPNRKLKYFRDQPLLNPNVTDEYLVLWHFEDWLKKYFFSVLQILETLSLDPLPYVRTQTINLIFILLRDTPEQEQNLLRLLVNKLGDTEKSVASRTSYHLQLLQTHPAMKAVIVREIISLVLRPSATTSSTTTSTTPSSNKHIRFGDAEPSKPKPKPAAAKEKLGGGNAHARYYTTVTFNQIVLTPADREVALQLIDVYFEMFKELLGEGKDEDEEGGGKDKEGLTEEEKKAELKADKKGRIRDGGKGKMWLCAVFQHDADAHPTTTTCFAARRQPHQVVLVRYPRCKPLAEEGSEGPFTNKADVCIIGSGMTGSCAAWHMSNLFKEEPSIRRDPLSVVVLEARKFCSGATGRNGGHLTQNVASSFLAKEARYNTTEAVKSFLLEEYNAQKLVQFIKDRNLEETVDFVNGGHVTLFRTEREAKALKRTGKLPKRQASTLGRDGSKMRNYMSKDLNLTGLFFDAHNFWPCKVATELLREAENASSNVNVRLHTLTPVTSVTAAPDEMADGQSRWSLQTPRGDIGCKYVIHATNAYASHLLPFLAGVESPIDKETTDDALMPGWGLNILKRPVRLFNRDTPRGAFGVIPTRGQIGTVRASVGPMDLGWLNSWGEHEGDEYWFPRYQDTKESTGGKHPLVVLGGGRRFSTHKETGITDDSSVNPEISRGMKKVMPELFPGKFSTPESGGASWEMEWSGIMAFTSDGDPFVGPVLSPFKDGKVLGTDNEDNYDGQYLAVGFSAHGMSRAYACAEVVVEMIAAKIKGEEWTSPAWLPQHYLSWAYGP
ncbi:hypothetical protein D9613_009138 [Agrocybe pediades]|uniref:FAD dependent oxidoreductase domain-containing protein n=1 Tax=Agrocybe pediades TaxID=84607 RepID=A0A8H4R5E6_9AGAR|nr:hypothetical protein D9613_009138 [Agrocybe pediades]